MESPPLGSILLGTADVERLRAWYDATLAPHHGEHGWLDFGGMGVLIDQRDDVATSNPEPGRMILNFHVRDAKAAVERLDQIGVTWVVELEERADGMWFATLADPDGNYIQLIQTK